MDSCNRLTELWVAEAVAQDARAPSRVRKLGDILARLTTQKATQMTGRSKGQQEAGLNDALHQEKSPLLAPAAAAPGSGPAATSVADTRAGPSPPAPTPPKAQKKNKTPKSDRVRVALLSDEEDDEDDDDEAVHHGEGDSVQRADADADAVAASRGAPEQV